MHSHDAGFPLNGKSLNLQGWLLIARRKQNMGHVLPGVMGYLDTMPGGMGAQGDESS